MPLHHILAAVRGTRRPLPDMGPPSELADLVEVYAHGQPNGLRKWWTGQPARDWTSGRVALTNREMRGVWPLVPTGARVLIHP